MARSCHLAIVERFACSLVVVVAGSACDLDEPEDDAFGTAEAAIALSTTEALGVLRLANTATLAQLTADVHLTATTASNIEAYRLGDDGVAETADDQIFDSVDELDAVPYVGPLAFSRLLGYARNHGYIPNEGDPEAIAPSNVDPRYVHYVYRAGLEVPVVLGPGGVVRIDALWGSITQDGRTIRRAGVGVVDGIGFYRDADRGVHIMAFAGLTLARGAVLRPEGTLPLLLLSVGDVEVRGVIDVSAGSEGGIGALAGGFISGGSCGNPVRGAGGGGHGQRGGDGGTVFAPRCETESGTQCTCGTLPGGRGDSQHGFAQLVPLRGGAGGDTKIVPIGWPYISGYQYFDGGDGGGAVQLSSLTRIDIRGEPGSPAGVNAAGEGGSGGGGGAGGGILLEAPEISIGEGAVLAANGGSGEGDRGTFGAEPAGGNACGAGGSVWTTPLPGCDGGGGGGGGAGRIRFNTFDGLLDWSPAAIVSPLATTGELRVVE